MSGIIAYVERVWGGFTKLFHSLPAWIQAFVTKIGSQEGTILQGLVNAAVADLMQDIQNPSQLSSAQIGAQAAAIFAQLVSQNISTFTLQDVYATLNTALSAQSAAGAAATAAVTDAAPVTVVEPIVGETDTPAVVAAPSATTAES